MNLNQGFNREIFGFIKPMAEEKDLTETNLQIIENQDNDPDMILITSSGLNPFEITKEKTPADESEEIFDFTNMSVEENITEDITKEEAETV